MKVDTPISGPIHPQSTHMRLLTNSNKDLKIGTSKLGPVSFELTQGSLEHTSSLNMISKWKSTSIFLPIYESQLQD